MYNRLKLLITLLALLAAGQVALAQTFSVEGTTSGNTTTFKIKRSGNNLPSQTVKFRTVSLSAIAGQHFTAISDEVSFGAGDTEQSVEVTETASGSMDEQYRFQTGTSRTYRLEVIDQDGFFLAGCDRNIDYSSIYRHTDNYVNRSVTDLVYFTDSGILSSGSGNKYLDVSYSSSEWTQVTDAGYSQQQDPCTVSTNSLYNSSTELRNYLNRSYNNYKMYATVYFTQKEEHDGYQYIQIYTGSSYDTGDDPNGKVDDPVNSLYKACFILSYDPSGSVMSDPHYQFFPHRYDYEDKAKEKTNGITHYEFDYGNSHLYEQKYVNSTYKSSTSGSLILTTTTSNLKIRFDAGGGGTDHDQWDFKDLKVRLALVDAISPTLAANGTSGIKVTAGPYYKGNTFYVSVPFSEIVTVSGTPTLTNNWGTLSYASGSGSNVLTFRGTITNNIGSPLSVTGLSGTVKDLAGNQFNWIGGTQVTFDNTVVSSSPAYTITYDLADGYMASANPATFTYGAAVTIDKVPLRPGYVFAGWTGSNGSTPQATVTIPAGEHGSKGYTANWTPIWGQDQDADGTKDHPYVISTTEGLDMLAKVVDGLDGYTATDFQGTYFELGDDITYSTVDLDSTASNFTQIGGNFDQGDKDFCGIFDGRGHTISGIRLYRSMTNHNPFKNIALFGRTTGATLRNVTVSDARFTGYSYVGGIVGNSKNSTVENCIVIDSGITFKTKNGGVILGNNNGCTLTSNYYRNCTVTVESTTYSTDIGIGSGSTISSDQNGARCVHSITVGESIVAYGNGVQIGDTKYYASTDIIMLNYNDIPEGYHVHFSYYDGTNHAISGSFFIMPDADITVSASLSSALETFSLAAGSKDGIGAYWGTFYDSRYNYTLSEGAVAYTMGSDYHLYRLGDDGRIIPKGTAVIVMATDPGVILTCTGTDKLTVAVHGGKNILVGSDVAQTYASLCVMSVSTSGEVGFFKLSDVTLPAFKAGYVPPVDGGLQDYDKQNKQEW